MSLFGNSEWIKRNKVAAVENKQIEYTIYCKYEYIVTVWDMCTRTILASTRSEAERIFIDKLYEENAVFNDDDLAILNMSLIEEKEYVPDLPRLNKELFPELEYVPKSKTARKNK
jgi:hypothetical protein